MTGSATCWPQGLLGVLEFVAARGDAAKAAQVERAVGFTRTTLATRTDRIPVETYYTGVEAAAPPSRRPGTVRGSHRLRPGLRGRPQRMGDRRRRARRADAKAGPGALGVLEGLLLPRALPFLDPPFPGPPAAAGKPVASSSADGPVTVRAISASSVRATGRTPNSRRIRPARRIPLIAGRGMAA